MREKSPDLQLKAKLREQKQYARWSAGGAWLPRLDWQLSENQSNANMFTGAIGPDSRYEQSVLALSFPIYRRSTHLNLQLAQSEYELADEDYQGALQETDFKLRQWVGELLVSQYKLAALEKSLSAMQRTLRETKIRFEQGSRSQLDLLRIQAQLTSLESQSLSAQNEVRKNLDRLLQLSGLSLQDLQEADFPLTSGNEEQLEKMIRELTEFAPLGSMRPASRRDRAQVMNQFAERGRAQRSAAINLAISQAKANLVFAKEWPELAVKATQQKVANNWSDLKDSPEGRTIGVTLTIPIFNFGSGFSVYRESEALVSTARIQNDQSLNSSRLQVEQLFDQISLLQKLVQAHELRRNQSFELERLTMKSYEFGKSTVQDLLSAQNETLNAKVDVAKSRLELVIAERQLEWNLGNISSSL